MRKKLAISSMGLILFLAFVIFSYLVHKDLLSQFDFDITVKLQDNLSRRFDSFFSFFSLVGSFEVLTVFLVGILILRRKVLGVFVFFLYGGLHVLELFGKLFVEHPGPPFMFFRNDIDVRFPTSHVVTGFSYPSGHSARTAFFSTIIFLMVWKSKKLSPISKLVILSLVFIFDVIMFVSRPYLGEHWTSDVIGGALLGAALGLLGSFVL